MRVCSRVWKLSKVISVVSVSSRFSTELTFENYYLRFAHTVCNRVRPREVGLFVQKYRALVGK